LLKLNKMKKIIYISVLSIFSLTSCSDDKGIETNVVTENKVASIEDYFEFLNTETNGSVIVQSISTPLSSEAFMATSSIKGDKTPLALKVAEKTVSFTNRQYSQVANKSYSNVNLDNMSEIFGSTFKVALSENQLEAKKTSNNSSSSDAVESVYIPSIVKADYFGLKEGKIVSGSEIVWNADDQNENGVVISIEYNPLSQLEESVVNAKSDNLLKGNTTEDDGSYTITTKDLAEFPQNAILTFYVARAGYGISTNDAGEDYSLAGLTVNRADFKIQK
jgi:opacity protein-like surface antigen|tara:strand:- start:3819 stop:4649 length:831 start_codon:yes stop_codon:yes gene_type:complete